MTPFLDHNDGAGIVLNPRSIMQVSVERVEVPWSELRSQSHQSFDKWVTKVVNPILRPVE